MVRALDIKVLAGLEPISTLGAARLRELLEYCRLESVPEGNDPFRAHGLEGQSVYLMEGEVELFYRDGNHVVIEANSEWAKHPLGKRQPDIVAARARSDSQLLRVDDELLDRLVMLDQMARHEMPVSHVEARPAEGAERDNVRHLLHSKIFSAEYLRSGPLAHLPMSNITALLQRFEPIAVWAGDVVIREGEDGDYYYLIDSGRAEVTRHVGGVEVRLAELTAGDVFGEEALISGTKRNATITMKTNGVLLRLERRDFLALMQEPLLHRISYADACLAVAQGAVWLDVRHPSEYRYDHLQGAMNVPLNEVRNAIGVLDRNKKYLAYCQSGRRSAAAAFILAQAGYDIQVLDGGLWSVPKSGHQ